MRNSPLAYLAVGAVLTLTIAACEPPPPEVTQLGFRGVGMEHVANPRTVADSVASVEARVPELPMNPAADQTPAPSGTFQNVQVLGHLSEAEFNRFKLAMTTWVAQSTGEGCNYCHVLEADGTVNFVSDDKYQKVVSRSMIAMTQNINENYSNHVGEAGVNCWTCHMGEALPNNYWFYDAPGQAGLGRYFVSQNGQTQPERYYLDQENVRVVSREAALTADTDNSASIQDTEQIYWLMMQMSESLGVNCTFCHTTPRFSDWEVSPPQRATALRGAHMLRAVNMEYMVTLQDAWPENRLGPMGDGPKIQCSTCHNGASIPQFGNPASHATAWPALTRVGIAHANVAPEEVAPEEMEAANP